jgi:hypothetical protein
LQGSPHEPNSPSKFYHCKKEEKQAVENLTWNVCTGGCHPFFLTMARGLLLPPLSPPLPLVSRGQFETGDEQNEAGDFFLYKKKRKERTSLTLTQTLSPFFSSLFPGDYLLPGLGFRCFLGAC